MFNLSKIYEYILDIEKLKKFGSDTSSVQNSSLALKHSMNMCILQIGEFANRIDSIQQDSGIDIVDKKFFPIESIRGLRNRIAHTYENLDPIVLSDTISKDIPDLKQYILNIVNIDVLNNPYSLYEKEYDELIK